MSIFAEIAQLAVELKLGTTGSFKTATSELAGVEGAAARGTAATGLLGGGFAKASTAAGRFGGALGHAQKQIGGLLTGPLGVLGLTGGLLTFGGVIEQSLHKTSDFALTLERLTALTGESAQSMGELALVAEKYGVDSTRLAQIVGFAEKTLGKLDPTVAKTAVSHEKLQKAQEGVTKASERLAVAELKLHETEQKRHLTASQLATAENHVKDAEVALADARAKLAGLTDKSGQATSKLLALQKQYGVVLVDSTGKAVNFSTELNHVADYYTSNASASDKAALAAQLFGRGYATMIPILQLGSAGIARAKSAIDDMGLSLGTDSKGALEAYKQSLRSLGEAVNVLQIQIGLALAPVVTDLANNISGFLEHGGAKQIVGFFKSGAQFAQSLGKAVQDDVIPAFKLIAGAWASIPDDLKKLLIGGFVVNKASSFLFGKGIVGAAAGGIKGILEGLLGRVPGAKQIVGATDPGMRVYVTNWPLGGLGGLPGAGGIGTAAAAIGGGSVLAGLGLAGGVTAAIVAAALLIINEPTFKAQVIAGAQGTATARGLNPANVSTDLGGRRVNAVGSATVTLSGKNADDIALATMLTAQRIQDVKDASQSIAGSATHLIGLSALIIEFRGIRDALAHSKGTEDIRKAMQATLGFIVKRGRGDVSGAQTALAGLKTALSHTHDPKLEAELKSAIHRVEEKIVIREYGNKELALATKILGSNESAVRKAAEIKTIEQQLKDHGLPKVADQIRAKLEAAKAGIVTAIHNQKLSVTVQNQQSTSVIVNSRDILRSQTSYSKFYSSTKQGMTR